ncbi:hypothetical protein [Clostridium drakei]|uniref:Uncharacterized protein n=1 Tax=Clostridium drakei TaxID=332101 RepID=A0A2U8DNJ7_9CLOT|nr:hypothetical protein [Clostridium drakei]AWI04148.1 hypothetical protein B9W14_06440 [Clostridium drakei]
MNKVVLQEDLEKVDLKIGDLGNLDTKLLEALNTESKSIDCVNALNEVFQCGNNAKSDIVTALIAKGCTSVTVDSNWPDIITAIKNLTVGTSNIRQLLKQAVTASSSSPYSVNINLGRTVDNLLLALAVLTFTEGAKGLVKNIDTFDSGANYTFAAGSLNFDGKMYPANNINISWISDSDVGINKCYEVEIDETLYKTRDAISQNDTQVTIGVIPKDQVILSKNDIDISAIVNLTGIVLNSVGFKFALSFDNGTTYQVFDGTSWKTVDVNNIDDVKANFMAQSILNGLTAAQLATARNSSNSLRIAYYCKQTYSTDACYVDQTDVKYDESGTYSITPQANWSYKLLDDKQTLQVTFYASGVYTVNYV